MKIKILALGCKNCIIFEANIKEAIAKLGLEAEIEKITDLVEIAKYGILSTPGLVIDEKVVSFGKVLNPKDIARIIEKMAK